MTRREAIQFVDREIEEKFRYRLRLDVRKFVSKQALIAFEEGSPHGPTAETRQRAEENAYHTFDTR